LHYFDPHSGYNPPEPFATLFKDNLYAGEIAYTDYCIGQVIKKLKDLNIYDSTLLIITSDHGESLSEHSERDHGYFIYQSTVHIPLIIRVPGGPKGKIVKETVGLIDIVPKNEKYIYCESLLPTRYGCSPLFGVVKDRWKYIHAPRPELYELDKDPHEGKNLIDEHPMRAQLLQGHLKSILEEQTRTNASGDKFVPDQQTLKRLESLGYVAGAGLSEDFEFDSTKRDPKDSIRLHEQIMLTRTFINSKQYNKAQTVCNQILLERPEYIHNSLLLGQIAMGKKDAVQAITHFSKFLSQLDAEGAYSKDGSLYFLSMDVSNAHNHLGMAFMEQENFDRAIVHYNKALEINPGFANVYYNLGYVFFKQGKLEEAIACYKKAIELRPDYRDALHNLQVVQSLEEKREKN
jgi:tetratricopeptide (TPR) repeat protein